MADRDFKQRYWGRLQQLQKEHLEARKAGDFALAKKRKEDIRRIAAAPFDNYIRRVDNPNGEQSIGEGQSDGTGSPDNMGEAQGDDIDQEQQFGQPIDQTKQQEQRTVGQEQADAAQQKVIGEQPTVTPPKAEPPGGLAQTAVKQPTPQPKTPAQEGQPRSGAGGAVDKGKQVAQQAADQAMKYMKKMAAQLVKKAVVAFFSSPYGWAIIGIILGLILLVLIIVLLWSVVFGSHRVVSSTGATISQATNPQTDKEWLQRLLLFSGDKSVQSILTQKTIQDITAYFNNIKSSGKFADKATEIDKALADLAAYQPGSDTDQSKGKALIKELQDLLASLTIVTPIPPGTTTSPIFGTAGIGRLNQKPHFGTFGCPSGGSCEAKFINMDHPARTYQQSGDNTCDAVDIVHPSGTTAVHAVLDGEVTMNNLLGSGIWIKSTLGGHDYVLTYAHIQSELSIGKKVKSGEVIGNTAKIGNTSGDIVHFEISLDGKCVVNLPKDNMLPKDNGDFQAGEKLWAKMKTVLRQ